MWQFFFGENRKIWNQISTIHMLRKTIDLTSSSSFALLFEHKLIFHLDSRSFSVQIISNKVSSHRGNFKNPGKQSGRSWTTILLERSRLHSIDPSLSQEYCQQRIWSYGFVKICGKSDSELIFLRSRKSMKNRKLIIYLQFNKFRIVKYLNRNFIEVCILEFSFS